MKETEGEGDERGRESEERWGVGGQVFVSEYVVPTC